MHKEGSVFSEPSASFGSEIYRQAVSGWCGLVALVKLHGFGWEYAGCCAVDWLTGAGSPNQIPVVDTVLASWWRCLPAGGAFAYVERLRADEVIRGILGVPRMPAPMTVTRYFGGLVRRQ